MEFSKEDELVVAFSTRKEEKDFGPLIETIQKAAGCRVKVFAVINPNGVSLTKAYNEVIRQHPDNRYFIFMHDDIEPLTVGWGKKIVDIFKRNEGFGIIGVAGSKDYEKEGGWWQFGNLLGQVEHRKDGNSWLTSFSPYFKEDLQEACVVDGLFIALDRGRTDEMFDETVSGFNFYDIDFCLSNFTKKKCRIGVTTQIRLAHESVGMVKPEWVVNHKITGEKFNEFLPIRNLVCNAEEKQS